MPTKCIFCGRQVIGRNICEYCEEFICEVCGRSLARGYCAVCGRLVCDVDSRFVGFARVCNDCISVDENLGDYDYLRGFLRRKTLDRVNVTFSRFFESGKIDGGHNLFLFVGLDDFDSPYGMCTTYAAAVLVAELLNNGKVEFMDYPLLVRLNPNVPVKTRGNASIGLRMRVFVDNVSFVKKFILERLSRMAHFFFRKTQPAIAFYVVKDFVVDKNIYLIYSKALRTVITRGESINLAKNIGTGHLEIFTPDGFFSRGIIGALSAIGAIFEDYTYEILVYRKRSRIHEKRIIDPQSVLLMDKNLSPFVFGNVDEKRILIAPAGPDPVLMGIRGEFPEKILEAFSMIRHEEHDLWCIFRTNQATGMHIRKIEKPEYARPYETVMMDIVVERLDYKDEVTVIVGRSDEWLVHVRIYRLQKGIRKIVSSLRKNDRIRVVMSVIKRGERILVGNFEEFFPLELSPIRIERNPPCPICCARLKKKGKKEMYCKKCGYRIRDVFKVVLTKDRLFPETKKRYLPSPRSHRHLTISNTRILFRAKKIAGLIRPYMINIFCGREKPHPEDIRRVFYITNPKIM